MCDRVKRRASVTKQERLYRDEEVSDRNIDEQERMPLLSV